MSLLRGIFAGNANSSPWNTDSIIRDELFSVERLEQHATSLAEAQTVTAKPRSCRSLNARLSDNEAVLLAAYRSIAAAAKDGAAITPAAEWLIDNYHLVEEQIRQIQDDLPPRFYRQLPKLASGPLAGYPRVFGLAWACVAHSDSRFDPETLRRFVQAYQHVQPLTIGELWAVAITLRIVLVENLRRAAERIVGSRTARDDADRVADQLLGINGFTADPEALLRGYDKDAKFAPVFVVQVVKRLRDQDPRVTPALKWLENQLVTQGTTSEDMVRDEHQRQGASNVTVRNIITSMRRVSDLNWPDFFESVSLVDAALRDASEFASMDFTTRNLYRSEIEALARGSKYTELEITHAVVKIARQHAGHTTQAKRLTDPGYHLLAGGRRALERAIGYRPPWRHWHNRVNASIGPGGYITAVWLMTALVLTVPMTTLYEDGVASRLLAVLLLLGVVPSIDLGIALVNRLVARSFGATTLPGLALRAGVPPHLRTIVVMPTLLTSREAIEAHIEHLEVHYLASAHGEVHFALLSDWVDADSEHTADDEHLLQIAVQGIGRLNRMHGPAVEGARFYLLHRRRVWSEGEQRWMGWERKRGKLHELNRLLRGATDTTFVAIDGEKVQAPPEVRYVITLDADTRLPRETLRRLVGKLAHPLNQPRFDAATGRVVEGYAVLQPRVTPSLPVGLEGSLYRRVFSSMNGIDAYDAAVSDVYQDLFAAGSYAGKGIYDVDAFEAALHGRVPDGTLLSHDLFEGTFARAGLASDIEVVEEFPSRYDVSAARSHRWARGDWQLLPWILNRGRVAQQSRGSLPLIAVWKMADNLRRTLSAPACIAALMVGWLLPLKAAALWTAFICTTIAIPALIPVFSAIIPRRRGILARSHLRALRRDLWLALLQITFLITLLAHQAWLMTDAIARTLYRLIFTRRHLLEWMTMAQAELSSRLTLGSAYRRMGASVLVAALVAIEALTLGRGALWLALPFAAIWLAAPAIARSISNAPLVAGQLPVTSKDAHALRLVARRTWRFFETFVTAEDNMLPPDNFQEDPQPVVAHRTSPTNLGLYLLCVVSARDFGWLGTLACVERLEATLATMARLERFRGHFYNWYDTRDLRALDPHYVSSVDSGNLAAHLIALANACREWIATPVPVAVSMAGIEDALQLMHEALAALPPDLKTPMRSDRQLEQALTAVRTALAGDASTDIQAYLATLLTHTATLDDCARVLASEHADGVLADTLYWVQAVQHSIESWRQDVRLSQTARNALEQRLLAIEAAARATALAMEFDFLLDPERKLLSIGYLAADGTLDPSCYDLLASEARLASFFAIAKRDVTARHWFKLGRSVTAISYGAALISWSGSMFEYLMPSLVMRAPAGSLLEQTNRLIVRRQITYGASQHVPWGISESAYSARDLEFTYQYSNFGVPGLGLKRGLSENLVVAPYATALAAMIDPYAATRNFERLQDIGARGRYGFYEALDFTRARLPEGKNLVIVCAYMAHHQGMSIVAIGNVLFDGRMRQRFHAESSVQATELLLQERTPREVSIAHPRAEEVTIASRVGSGQFPEVRRLHTPHDATPQTHLLSNGRYSVMLSAAGSGYSRWRDFAITRWREDTTRDDSGSYLYLRDVRNGQVWSAGYQPCGVDAARYEVTFTDDRAEFIRHDGTTITTLEVVVSPEDDAEVRRLSIANTGSSVLDIDVTSYNELALAPPAADAAHPAFSKLFVQTEYAEKLGALIATRRRRAPSENEVWAAHLVVVEGQVSRAAQFETDRLRFLGRGREVHEPLAIDEDMPLSGTVGTVLDPIFALRRRVRIQPGTTARLSFWTVVAATRDDVLNLIDKHHDANSFVRASTLAWTQAQVQLRHIDVSQEEANLFQRLASHLIYADGSLRPNSDSIQRGNLTRAALWAMGISGDLPILLLRIDDIEDLAIARQLLRAHEYWRLKQLAVDLVILNERASSYVQDLQTALDTIVRTSQSRRRIGTDGAQGNVFVVRADLIAAESRAVLSSIARAVFVAQRGTLEEQLERRAEPPRAPPRARAIEIKSNGALATPSPHDLEYFNGLGGFAQQGREYAITLDSKQSTPAPWINVIANPQFGFQVAAEGSGYTWSVNSRENQLTQWSNDPVTDRGGECWYVRDDETGDLWGPTLAPVRADGGEYSIHHGQGYSRFEHTAHGIELALTMFVPRMDPIKICRLAIRNTTARPRFLSVTAYIEWVLGTHRGASAPFITTELDTETHAIFARNPWNTAFGARVAFADLGGRQAEWTGDRREFLGRHGKLNQPAALLTATAFSRRVGAGLDPCAAFRTQLKLAPGEVTEVVFLLGEADSVHSARELVTRYRTTNLDSVLLEMTQFWDDTLGTVQVKTPDRTLDIMLNRWLLYQSLVCRVWARSAFYQASGAYGFRDQLQDGMAITVSQPAFTREHLLRAAGRQFAEGDVQHWWLPPLGQGVRTHISDDPVWLAYTAANYLSVTGDASVLDERVPFIEGAKVGPGDHDAFYEPHVSDESVTFFEHCALALDDSLRFGVHGLPLMGTGDWNDGMNRVGELGRGESVWLGWFLYKTLREFAPIAAARGEHERVARWLAQASELRAALERDAWDGAWYRRGYFDDGTPLGSASSDECRIDSIAQSWSVLSQGAAPERAAQAMAAVDEQLIRRGDNIALLFTPPFDRTPLDPGYIKGYPPGLRENGGQYTHAATWSVLAFAQLGQGEKAAELFSLLNPISHTSSRIGVRRYKVEPYVVAADVYSVAPHAGRGGWTWYTGSAGWLYRAGLEGILGFQQQGDHLLIAPCIPQDWPRFEIQFRYRSAHYAIVVENPQRVSRGVASLELDGNMLTAGTKGVPLADDGRQHQVTVTLG